MPDEFKNKSEPELIDLLNGGDMETRLSALSALAQKNVFGAATAQYVNNHIHTTYSFSPYSPTKAVYMAKLAGLTTAGIMDHDSVAGAGEFIRAGEVAGIATTVGIECRCSMRGTPFEGKKLNNPDQASIAYLTLHGIPHGSIDRVQDYMAPYRAARSARNRAMTERLDAVFTPFGIKLGYDNDVLPISQAAQGGTVTERHILFALAKKIISQYGAGPALADFIIDKLNVNIPAALLEKLKNAETSYYEYHLLGLLKGNFVDRFYIDARDELPHVTDFLRLGEETGAISAYAYLGDVKNSVTGDKKDETFEDAFLDELVEWVSASGFHAFTYMPARNTAGQLDRVAALCSRHNLFQISGEDINTPFQDFICKALNDPRHAHLIEATWALIGHEKAATRSRELGMFTAHTINETPDLYERIKKFAQIGRNSHM